MYLLAASLRLQFAWLQRLLARWQAPTHPLDQSINQKTTESWVSKLPSSEEEEEEGRESEFILTADCPSLTAALKDL